MKKRYLILYCFLISFFYLMIASKCSFLYVINDWVDSNAFFTMGKGMAHGLVPFRDLFEQKGPLLYLFHMIAYWISNDSFFGIYLLEVLFFTVFLYYIYRIASFYLTPKNSLFVVPIMASFLLIHPSFRMGDSAEEFIVPMLTYSLFLFLSSLKNKKELSYTDFILNGLVAGCVIWIKYTMIGFWFAWMMFYFFFYLNKKEWKKMMMSSFSFLLGMFLATLPWIIYFGYHQAIDDLIYVYFILNKNAYSYQISLLSRIFLPFQVFYTNLKKYPITFWLFLLGCFFLFFKQKEKRKNLFICELFLFLVFTVYIGGFGYQYYFYIFLPFLVFGIISMIDYFQFPMKRMIPMLSFFTILCFFFVLGGNANVKDLNKKKENYAQYVFLEEIEKEKNPTLLNYGFIDGGFYLTSNIVPNVYYFEKLNFKYENYPENMDEQNRYVKEKLVQFIVLKTKATNRCDFLDVPYLYDGYECIKEFVEENGKKKYVLLKRKET